MANYTTVSPTELDEIVSHYAIGKPQRLEEIPGGLGNSNFKLTTTDGVFLLKICNEKNRAELQMQIELLEHLRQHNYPTPYPIDKTNGESVHLTTIQTSGTASTCYVMLYPFLPGGPLTPSPETLAQIGAVLGKLHCIPPPDIHNGRCVRSPMRKGLPRFPMGVSQMVPFLQEVEGTQFAAHPFVKYLNSQLKRLEPRLSESLPTGLLHGDLFGDNTLFQDDKLIAILDFEEGAHDTLLIDVGMAVVGCCYTAQHQLNIAAVHRFLEVYDTVRPLTRREWECLDDFVHYAALSIAFWRFRQFNIRRPNKQRANTYQEMITRITHWSRFVPLVKKSRARSTEQL